MTEMAQEKGLMDIPAKDGYFSKEIPVRPMPTQTEVKPIKRLLSGTFEKERAKFYIRAAQEIGADYVTARAGRLSPEGPRVPRGCTYLKIVDYDQIYEAFMAKTRELLERGI